MINEELMAELFEKEVERLGRMSGLSDGEKERIIQVYKQALSNPYMDERVIFPALTGEEALNS